MIIVRTMHGLGDNVYHRPFIKSLSEKTPIHLATPWPQLFEDLPNVTIIDMGRATLRTQSKNIREYKETHDLENLGSGHTFIISHNNPNCSIWQAYGQMKYPLTTNHIMDLPTVPVSSRFPTDKPVAIIRPATIRKEWSNESRNPLQEYIQIAVNALAGYHRVLIADIDERYEWYDGGSITGCETYFEHGELSIEELIYFTTNAAVSIGGVGWLLPMGIAAKTPTFIIFGGQGKLNSPEKLTDPIMELGNFGYALPDDFCRCDQPLHTCDKTINSFGDKFNNWLITQGLKL